MLPNEPSLTELRHARERFLALVADVRPDLHRYCARMTGSVADGEDVVQDTLARAYFLLPELPSIPDLRPWLFRVAHHRAIDFLRRYERRMGQSLKDDAAFVDDGIAADDALAGQEALASALASFVELPPIPRSSVILKDVLGHSLEEIASLLELGLPAVKAAIHRGRKALERSRIAAAQTPDARTIDRDDGAATPTTPSAPMAKYIALFNARDWDAVRRMLADDVRLDVVSRAKRRGSREVGAYVSNYADVHDWYLRAAWLDGREVIAVTRSAESTRPAYFVEIVFRDGQVIDIRDFRYVPYIAADAALEIEPRVTST